MSTCAPRSRSSLIALFGLLTIALGLAQLYALPTVPATTPEEGKTRPNVCPLTRAQDSVAFCERLGAFMPDPPRQQEPGKPCTDALPKDTRAKIWRSLFWDQWFALSYGILGWLIARSLHDSWTRSQRTNNWSFRLRMIGVGYLLAAVLDIGENTLLAWTLQGEMDRIGAMRLASDGKWALFALSILGTAASWIHLALPTIRTILYSLIKPGRLQRLWDWARKQLVKMEISFRDPANPDGGALHHLWTALHSAAGLLLLIRIPLLIVALGVILTRHIEQVSSILDLSVTNAIWGWFAFAASAILGVLVWFSARTLYAFRWQHLPEANQWLRAGEWLPRLLGVLPPLTLMIGMQSRAARENLYSLYWAFAYGMQIPILLGFMIARRMLLNRQLPMVSLAPATPANHASTTIASSPPPPIGTYHRWLQLPTSTLWFHAAGPMVLLIATIVGAMAPAWFDRIGPQALILLAAAWVVWASTLPVYLAARARFPLVSALLILALLSSSIPQFLQTTYALVLLAFLLWWTSRKIAITWPDGAFHRSGASAIVFSLLMVSLIFLVMSRGGGLFHTVRLQDSLSSLELPSPNVWSPDHPSATHRRDMEVWLKRWAESHGDCPQIYLVSSEGGGIRAAMWTAMVLEKLQDSAAALETRAHDFWNCTLAASGVSGGSLGLAMVAAVQRDRIRLQPHHPQLGPWNDMASRALGHDFLGPVLGRMFGTDQLQALLPIGMFSDRGQVLEDRWRERYHDTLALGPNPAPATTVSFSDSLACSLYAQCTQTGDADRPLTALLFNTTVVHTGQRLVQHPFRPWGAEEFPFQGAIDGATWLPATLPLSSAALNSARFTYVSPAGNVYTPAESAWKLQGQLVDGGYFENSGTLTLNEFVVYALRIAKGSKIELPSRLRFIHISNDTKAPGFMADGSDQCLERLEAEEVESSSGILAPPIALLNTREARGDQARRALHATARQFGGLHHFRLCRSPQNLPLGWTLSPDSIKEIQAQRDGTATNHARNIQRLWSDVFQPLADQNSVTER